MPTLADLGYKSRFGNWRLSENVEDLRRDPSDPLNRLRPDPLPVSLAALADRQKTGEVPAGLAQSVLGRGPYDADIAAYAKRAEHEGEFGRQENQMPDLFSMSLASLTPSQVNAFLESAIGRRREPY